MKSAHVVFLFLLALAPAVGATSVHWRYRDALEYPNTYTTPECPGFGVTFPLLGLPICVDMFLTWEYFLDDDNDLSYHLTFDGPKSSNQKENIILAEYGDVASATMLRNLGDGQYLIHNRIDDGVPSQGGVTIDVKYGKLYYLAFVSEGVGTEIAYGWISFDMYGDGFVVRDYAYDSDGGPMIVGGGSAIPEPSGGLLFLLGGAALALRRRRRTPIEAAFAVLSEWERMSVRDRSRKL